ncbi:hypothetical protein EDD21DRAFT_401565 [Dissophora ornata]|nr:hypothetical protein EDD21DRAFT_401565 [Dissophora ornata]
MNRKRARLQSPSASISLDVEGQADMDNGRMPEVGERDIETETSHNRTQRCASCKNFGHARSNHSHCPMNPKRARLQVPSTSISLDAEYQADMENGRVPETCHNHLHDPAGPSINTSVDTLAPPNVPVDPPAPLALPVDDPAPPAVEPAASPVQVLAPIARRAFIEDLIKSKHAYRSMREQLQNGENVDEYNLFRCQYNLPASTEVSLIIPGEAITAASRDIIIQGRDGPFNRVFETSPIFDPLHFVLLHPHVEHGWTFKVIPRHDPAAGNDGGDDGEEIQVEEGELKVEGQADDGVEIDRGTTGNKWVTLAQFTSFRLMIPLIFCFTLERH